MTHIENQAVDIRIVNRFNGHGKLNYAQIGGKMAAGPGNTVHQKGPDLLTQLGLLLRREFEQIFVALHILQNTHEVTQPNVYFSSY